MQCCSVGIIKPVARIEWQQVEFGALPEEGTSLTIQLPDDPGDLAHSDEPPPWHLDVDVLEVEQYVPSQLRVTLVEPVLDDEDDHRDAETVPDDETSALDADSPVIAKQEADR